MGEGKSGHTWPPYPRTPTPIIDSHTYAHTHSHTHTRTHPSHTPHRLARAISTGTRITTKPDKGEGLGESECVSECVSECAGVRSARFNSALILKMKARYEEAREKLRMMMTTGE